MDPWSVVRYFVLVVTWREVDRGLGDEIISRGGTEGDGSGIGEPGFSHTKARRLEEWTRVLCARCALV